MFGGITYWLFGFGLTYGKLYSNPFIAFGYFAVDAGKNFSHVIIYLVKNIKAHSENMLL